MKLYYHPASTTCRPIMLFAAESGIEIEYQLVDLFTGEHMQPPYAEINPNKLVPLLEDGDFRLTESAAILKYLAEKTGSAAYPKELRARARVNEMMDWINTQLCRDLAYGLVYPQMLPNHKRPDTAVQQATVAWGQERARNWMKVLDQKLIGSGNAYLCGDMISIADYQGAAFVALAESIRSDLSAYPNVKRWLGGMKALKSWKKVNEAIDGFAASMKDVPFQAV
ncbi:MAG: glutathione S-transferase family protein [Betaproteobacteria bacterium]|nr:MAG: glutathione S-transferase family protein [Betaproteobacteria bacterium]